MESRTRPTERSAQASSKVMLTGTCATASRKPDKRPLRKTGVSDSEASSARNRAGVQRETGQTRGPQTHLNLRKHLGYREGAEQSNTFHGRTHRSCDQTQAAAVEQGRQGLWPVAE